MVKKKNESLLLLGTGKIMQKQQSVCVCVCYRERETERERDTGERQRNRYSYMFTSAQFQTPNSYQCYILLENPSA